MDKFPQYFHVAQLSQVVHDYTIGKHVHGQKIGKPQVAEGITKIFVPSRTEVVRFVGYLKGKRPTVFSPMLPK
jgi:hypothetical protein